jgi:tetratricopeptide (TPR) repeat protein
MKMRSELVISISEAGVSAARSLVCRIQAGDELLAERTLSPTASAEVRDISLQYISLFSKDCQAEEAQDYLQLLGDGLFHLFMEKDWEKIQSAVAEGARIVVASQIPEVLQLPWELLRFAGAAAVGMDPRYSLRRSPKEGELLRFSGSLSPGPLRVLFMACQPLDYSAEEKEFLKDMEGLDAAFQVCDTGLFQELQRRAAAFHPHLVCLFGQAVIKDKKGLFSFQGQGARSDLRSGQELAAALAESDVQCLLLGGCQRERPEAMHLLCQEAAGSLPLTIAWNFSAGSSKEFFSALCRGETVDEALGRSRREPWQKKIRPSPVLYSAGDQANIFDFRERAIAAKVQREQLPLAGFSQGYVLSFANRRDDLQRLSQALRGGACRTVVITGPEGAGKTALATRLAQELLAEGRSPLQVYCSENNPPSAARLLEAGIAALAKAGMPEVQMLRDSRIPLKERLQLLAEVINKGRYLLILDELKLEKKAATMEDRELAEFYLQALRLEGGRAIITCQALPADALTLPPRAWEWSLRGLPEPAFVKSLLEDDGLAECYRKGEVGYAALRKVYESVAGLPAGLAWMARALRSEEKDAGHLLAGLLSRLSPEAREALCRAAVYGVAVSPAGLAAAAGVAEEAVFIMAEEWRDLALAYRVGALWVIASSARAGLLALLAKEEISAAQRAAASFLREAAEAGRAGELNLVRLDCLLEARGHFMAGGDRAEARTVTARISGYLERRGYWKEILRLNQEITDGDGDSASRIWMARAYAGLGDYRKAQEFYARALEEGPEASAYYGLGTAYLLAGKRDLARESWQKALEGYRAVQDLPGEAAALQGLAGIDMEEKKDDASSQKLERVAEIQERLSDLHGRAATLGQMASLSLRQGDMDSARKRMHTALDILRQTNDRSGWSSLLINLASLDLERGELDLARQEFQEALAIKREMVDRKGQAAILHGLGSLESQAGEKEEASRSFQEALRIYQEVGDKSGEAAAFFQLGALAVQKDRIPQGLRLMALSAVILRMAKSEETGNVEPLVERLASQLNYSQEQFMEMVREVTGTYRRDRGWSLVEKGLGGGG